MEMAPLAATLRACALAGPAGWCTPPVAMMVELSPSTSTVTSAAAASAAAAPIRDVFSMPQSGCCRPPMSGSTGQSHPGVAPRQAPRSYRTVKAFPELLAAATAPASTVTVAAP